MVRKSGGNVNVLVGGDQLHDVADPSVSWDGRAVLFSGVVHPDSSWRIYRVGIGGDGFRQLTWTDRTLDLSQFGASASAFLRYDDFDPCWLPDGRVVFASTRHPSMASLGRVLTSNLYVMNADGSALHRITSERNGAEEPTIDPKTGRVVFARWWLNVDLPSNETREGLTRDPARALSSDVGNVWHAMSVNPDGNLLKLYAGFMRTRAGSQNYKPFVMADGRLLGVNSPFTALLPVPGGIGIRWFRAGADFGQHVIGARSGEGDEQAGSPFATDPVQLSGGTILVSYSAQGDDFGLFSCGLDGRTLTRIVDFPNTLELEPQVVRPVSPPPILRDEYPPILSELPPTQDPSSYFINDMFRFDCMNVYTNGAVDEPMPDAPVITTGAKIRFFLNSQRQNVAAPDPSILIRTANVHRNGGVHEPEAPADVPLFEQLVDSTGKVLKNSGGAFAHVTGMNYERMGGGTKCVGCHAGHSMLTVPVNASMAEWFNAATSAQVIGSSFFVSDKGRPFSPQRVVDRQARTGGDSVVWVANEGAGAFVLLTWDTPIEVKELIVYGISLNKAAGTTLRVNDAEIFLYDGSTEVHHISSTGPIRPGGTRLTVPRTRIDALKLVVTRCTGTIYHRSLAGLAEIETIARIY